jgi:hypothetical protein
MRIRNLLTALAALAFSATLAQPVMAATHHHKKTHHHCTCKHTKKHHKKHHAAKPKKAT